MKRFGIWALLLTATAWAATAANLMYIGTLDKKLLVIDEDKADVVGQIALGGIPRSTVLSPDHKTLYVVTTQMLLETVDLPSQKVTSSFSLADARSRPRMQASSPDIINLG